MHLEGLLIIMHQENGHVITIKRLHVHIALACFHIEGKLTSIHLFVLVITKGCLNSCPLKPESDSLLCDSKIINKS